MKAERVKKEVPELEGKVSLPVVGLKLKVSRQRIFQMIDEEKLRTVRRIPGAGVRPAAYVIDTAELDELLAAQLAAEECPQCAVDRANGAGAEFCTHAAQPEPVPAG
jgi:hypothetical protein